ncbi:hypothetical protein [Streptomyces sp. UNOB3_S3]|nr:hypothetical protein [Streptomyces sp. UNOB3_S3]
MTWIGNVSATPSPVRTDPNCKDCGGSGWIGDLNCPTCNGPGS